MFPEQKEPVVGRQWRDLPGEIHVDDEVIMRDVDLIVAEVTPEHDSPMRTSQWSVPALNPAAGLCPSKVTVSAPGRSRCTVTNGSRGRSGVKGFLV